jgi:hypothetical protein
MIFTDNYFDSTYAPNPSAYCASGINVQPTASGIKHGFVVISRNTFKGILGGTAGVYIPGTPNVQICDNSFIDCYNGILLTSPGPGGSGTDTIYLNGVQVYGNRFWTDGAQLDVGIFFFAADAPKNVLIYDNVTFISEYGLAHGGSIRRGINLNEDGRITLGAGSRIERNYTYGGGTASEGDQLANPGEVLLTSTSETKVAEAYRREIMLYEILVSYRVITATTNVTLAAEFRTPEGVQTVTFLPTTARAVGYYSDKFVVRAGGVTDAYVRLNATAGTANQVYISSEIRQIGVCDARG